MDIAHILTLIREFLVVILVFGALLAYAVVRGRRALMGLILGLYLALLVSLKFPYYDVIFGMSSQTDASHTIIRIIIFAIFTGLGAFLFERLLEEEYKESAFEGISKKAIVAALGTILVMAYSYHVLPLTEFVQPGVVVSNLFAPPEYFFWMLVLPLLGFLFI